MFELYNKNIFIFYLRALWAEISWCKVQSVNFYIKKRYCHCHRRRLCTVPISVARDASDRTQAAIVSAMFVYITYTIDECVHMRETERTFRLSG